MLPRVLATTSVFPEALGVGFSRSQVIISLSPSILVSIAMCVTSAYRRPIFVFLILPVKTLFKRQRLVSAQA